MGKSRKGRRILKRKTSRKKLRMSLQRLDEWLKGNRHQPVGKLIAKLNQKLVGHYGYYGITFNFPGIQNYQHRARRLLHKWLNRRGGKPNWCWGAYAGQLLAYYPLAPPRIVHKCF